MPSKSTPDYYMPAVTGLATNNSGDVYPGVQPLTWSNTRVTSENYSNWRYRISRGLDATTTLYGTKLSVKPGNGYWTYEHNSSPIYKGYAVGDIFGGYLYFSAPSGVVQKKAVAVAARNLVAKLRSNQTAWSAGTFAGELLEAVRFVKNPLKSLYRETDEYIGRLGRLKKVAQTDKAQYRKRMASTYLAYKLAAQPLANDIRDACVAMDNIRYGRRQKLKFSTNAEEKHSHGVTKQTSYALISGSLNPGGFYVSNVEDTTVTYRAGLTPREDGFIPPSSELGLTLPDIPVVAWELVPMSFIADYLANVDEILDALAVLALDFNYLNLTIRNSRTVQLSDGFDKLGPTVQYKRTVTGGECSTTYKNVSRVKVNPASLVPAFRLKLPSLGQRLNMAALAQAFQQARPTKFF